MDCLKPGDVAIFATPPAFRWVHFAYAIEKGLNVFMEKPVTVDGPSTRKLLALAEESVKKNLKVGVGLMIRHCHGRQELLARIKDGEIGDLIALRAYRMGGGGGMTGPYFQHQVWENGKNLSQRIRAEEAPALQTAIANRQLAEALAQEYIAVTVQWTRQCADDAALAKKTHDRGGVHPWVENGR